MESESIEIAGRTIPIADWDVTPESIKLAVEDLQGIVAQQNQRISALEEKINKNSKNSSIPPSKNGFGGQKKQEQNKQEQKVPKQRTKNTLSEKKLYPPEECRAIHEEKPKAGSQCGEELQGSDPFTGGIRSGMARCQENYSLRRWDYSVLESLPN